ncbi:MAG: enoyl-CoA hydratase/isomerase family protein [Woeseiaceae bacterium]
MPTVLFAVSGSIAFVTLNRPEKLNALDAAMQDELERALDRAEQDEDVRAVVLCGNGRAFSAGFDMEAADSGNDPEKIRRELQRDFDVIMRFRDCPKPVIAAVHGYCFGSSLEISAVCDITIAADDCRFAVPEVKYGSGIVCLVLPWVIGMKNANELLLTGTEIDAQRAMSMGLVNRIVPPSRLREEAESLARQIAANDSLAVRLTREAINQSLVAAGFRRALAEALEYDIRIETTDTPESAAFRKVMEKEGLKAALAWRAAQTNK